MLACRSCGTDKLEAVLSLGQMPLANALLAPEDLERAELRYPLDLVFCPGCTLVQITETVPPEQLFRHYLYFSSFSATFLRHAEDLASRVVRERSLGRGSLVVELASNDGYLLQFYRRCGIPVLGVEPAENVARLAREERGIPTVCGFFGRELARELLESGRRADVVHAHNVLAHVADLNGFVEGIALLLKPGGLAIVEVPYVKDMIDRCEFDTIYHEHLCYFSLSALLHLFERHALSLEGVERLAIHGGSLRLLVGPAARRGAAPSVERLLVEETAWGVERFDAYRSFAARAEALRDGLRRFLLGLAAEGRTIAAYGAAAKGTVLLNYLGLKPGTIAFVVDRSPHKQGRFVPGVRVPVRPVAALLEERPDYVLLLAWNLADEILDQQGEYRRRGGRFVVPVPELRVV